MAQNKTMLEKNRRVKKWDIRNMKMVEDMRSMSGRYLIEDERARWFASRKPYYANFMTA